MKEEGKTSKAPLTEAFANWSNLQDRAAGAVRPDRRPGRGLVHGPVLRAVLPDRAAQGRRDHGAADDRRRAPARHAVLRRLRHAVGQDRPQADHHGRLPARGADLLPALPGAHRGGQPRRSPRRRRRTRSSSHADPAQCSFQGSPVAREIDFKTLVRHRQALPGAELGQLRQRDAPAGTPATVTIGDKTISAAGGDGRQPEVRRRQRGQDRRVQEGDRRRPERRRLSGQGQADRRS